MSESLSKLYLCVVVCLCDSVCPARLVDACAPLCVQLGSGSWVMNQIKHTRTHIVTPDQTYICWTELRGPDRV